MKSNNYIAGAFAVLFVYCLYRFLNRKNDLTVHLEEQRELMKIGKAATDAGQGSLGEYPLSTIGDTPLAGVWFDPFMPDNPAAQPKDLVLSPWVMN